MLPKENRLTKKEDFSRVFEKGRYLGSGIVAIKFLKVEEDTLRIGLSVGKNFSKLATARNQARRIIRESIRKQLPEMKMGFDVIVMMKGDKERLTKKGKLSTEIEHDLKIIFSKTNLYK